MNSGISSISGICSKTTTRTDSYEGSYDFPPVHNVWRNASVAADFELAPVDLNMFPTAVETDSWGRIKSEFVK